MTHMQHSTSHHHAAPSQRRLAFDATLHCMTGCAIGEVAGMAIGTSLGIGMWPTVALAVTLAFITGFGLTMIPLMRSGMKMATALRIAFAADAVSVTVMEVVDNLVMMAIPGAMAAGPLEPLFWASLALALAVAFAVAFPINLWLIGRGKGHAVLHEFHH